MAHAVLKVNDHSKHPRRGMGLNHDGHWMSTVTAGWTASLGKTVGRILSLVKFFKYFEME